MDHARVRELRAEVTRLRAEFKQATFLHFVVPTREREQAVARLTAGYVEMQRERNHGDEGQV